MNLYVDLDNLQLMTAANDRRQVSIVSAKRGDALPLTVRFIRDGLPVRLDATTVISFAIKEQGKYDDDPLVLQEGFVASAVGAPDSDPNYTATPSLDTTELNALFLINGDSSDDPSTLSLMAELTWEATGDTGPTSIKTFTLRTQNDVYRGTETTPTSLPTPSDWLDAENITRTIQPIRADNSGAGTNVPLTFVVSGDILGDDTNPIPLSPLELLSFDGVTGRGSYEVTLADTGILALDWVSNDWVLTYDGPAAVAQIEYTATSLKQQPDGLTFTRTGGTDTLTLVDGEGYNAPLLGDLSYFSADQDLYFWNDLEWLAVTANAVLLTGDQTVAGAKTWTGLQRASGQNATAATGDELINRDSGDDRYMQISAPVATVPNYADDAAADADGALVSGSFYTTTAGARTVYVKP